MTKTNIQCILYKSLGEIQKDPNNCTFSEKYKDIKLSKKYKKMVDRFITFIYNKYTVEWAITKTVI